MKSFIFAILVIISFNCFSAIDVCVIEENPGYVKASCTLAEDNMYLISRHKQHSKHKAEIIKELLLSGYQIKSDSILVKIH